MTKKLSRTEQLDVERCVKNSGGNRFAMVITATARARQIARSTKGRQSYENAVMTSLMELQAQE